MLLGFLKEGLRTGGWECDGMFDWMKAELTPRGTLLPAEYQHIVDPDVVPDSKRPIGR